MGNSCFAEVLGHSACRAGRDVRYIKVAKLLHALHVSRADNSFERELRRWLAWDWTSTTSGCASSRPAVS
jgi:DNA replication protein DnaC